MLIQTSFGCAQLVALSAIVLLTGYVCFDGEVVSCGDVQVGARGQAQGEELGVVGDGFDALHM